MSNENSGFSVILGIILIIVGIYFLTQFVIFSAKVFVYCGYNSFFFLDNLFSLNPINSIITWGVFGLGIGSIVGVSMAIIKLRLSKLLILYPLSLVTAFILVMSFINRPTQYPVAGSIYEFNYNEPTVLNSAQLNVYYKLSTDVNVRLGHSANSSLLFVLPKGSEVELIQDGFYDSGGSEWLKIRHNSREGYVHSKYLSYSRMENTDKKKQIEAINSPAEESNSNRAEQTSNTNGFYIISVTAVSSESKAKEKSKELINKGYSSSYLWIPNYASLSGAQLYSVYIGPFKTENDCAIATEEYRKIQPSAFGILVSQDKKRVQINGIGEGNIIRKDVSSGPISCNGETKIGDKLVYITGDNVRVRIEPDASDEISMLFLLMKQDRAKVLDQITNAKGELWYQICYNGKAGWVIGRYAELHRVE